MAKCCSIDGCERPHSAKGLCQQHYNELPTEREKQRKRDRERRRNDPARREAERRRHASAEMGAYKRAWADRRRDWGAWWERERQAEDVAALKADAARGQRRQRKILRATKALGPPRQFIAGNCPDCGTPVVVTRGWWHDSIRCPPCTKSRWRENHRSRAIRHGVQFDVITPETVFIRDGYRCQICKRKTKGRWPALRSPSLDHIVPMAAGGAHVLENLQCACLSCNSRKGARSANDQLRMAV